MKKAILLSLILGINIFTTISVFAGEKPPICTNRWDLPKPVPDGYHFYCDYSSSDQKNIPIMLWNHAVLIKGFTMIRGILITETQTLNKVYFTAKRDPSHHIEDQPYLCSFPQVTCHPGTGGSDRTEFPGEYGM